MAEAVRAAAPEAAFLFIGGRRGLEADLVRAAGLRFHATPMPSLRDPDSRLSLVVRGLLLPVATVDALVQVARFRPSVCCTSGGLVAIPVVLAARLARVPVQLWVGDAIPGRALRLLAGWSTRIAATFESARPLLPRGRTAVTGNPIRASLRRWTRAAGREHLGIAAGETVIFVTGGSQGAERINEALFGALTRLLRRAIVVHHAGAAHAARAEARRAALPEDLRERYRPYAYLREEMGAALASADLVVGRAGSSSIAEPLAFGVPLVLIPFGAAASGHQAANARAAAESGAAAILREGELDADRLAAFVAGLLDDGERLRRMRTAASAAGRPDAADEIARELLAIGRCS
ncbi:MAG TPA: UDP-N-acetylglucosamine--N-acetylmuramyl-(pentapeptide) pyrophosphoryl-undecaprenol N-acetylglucosamine transferase [Candidatus Limnocylindrales bacterium]|nr:UDP-N-acetylglucosamine--N-acetylmuramyl-(pentapeptide) pyrophosphoryl-undecaprenol N-acetylglucosamine transferase [Candidatus Limnocylindrales bacterium]